MDDNCKSCSETEFNTCTCNHELKFAKPGKTKKKSRSISEKDHLNWVASQGCIICGSEACVHHIRIMGEPRDDFKSIPLCWHHHQGPEGIHTLGKYAWRKTYGHELDMLKKLMKRID
jgi:hypothetical protein